MGIFERRPPPEQYFNYKQLGHQAFQCQNTQQCARCAGEGHRLSEYPETMVKCVLSFVWAEATCRANESLPPFYSDWHSLVCPGRLPTRLSSISREQVAVWPWKMMDCSVRVSGVRNRIHKDCGELIMKFVAFPVLLDIHSFWSKTY